MFSYGRIRSAFAYAFPLLLGTLYIVAATFVYGQYLVRSKDLEKNNLFNRASVLSAQIKSDFSTTQQLEKSFRKITEEVIEGSEQKNFLLPVELAGAIAQNMPDEFLQKGRFWAFYGADENFKLASISGFEQSKKRAMEMAFTALINLADEQQDANRRKNSEKFITGLFGANSAPEYLATQRSGRLTPVYFEGKSCYLFWQHFKTDQKCIGGLMAVFAYEFIEDPEGGLRRLANKLNENKKHDFSVTFLGSPMVEKKFKLIGPGSRKKSAEALQIHSSLKETTQKYQDLPMRKMHHQGNWWHFIDLISHENHYYSVISGKIAPPETGEIAIGLRTFTIFALLWSAVFFLRLRHNRFGIGLAFRLLFFMTGMLPVLGLGDIGINMIDQSHEAAIQQTVQSAYDTVGQIDENSEDCIALAGLNIKEMLADKKTHAGLVSADYNTRNKTFSQFQKQLKQRGFFLNYLLVIRPGEPEEYHVSEAAHLPLARYHLEYYKISTNALHDLLIRHDPSLPNIPLTAIQKSLKESFGGPDNPATKDVFLSSHERISTYQTGSVEKHVFFTSIMQNHDQIACYLIMGMSISETVLEIIKTQLNTMNAKPGMQFFCLSRDFASGIKIYPQKSRVLNSTTGQEFRHFVESAASSMFRLETRHSDSIFIYEPLNKVKHYFSGAIIDLSEINQTRILRLLLLLIILGMLSGIIYLLASAVSSLMITPARQLTRVFGEIASGNYSTDFSYPYDNELGQLARATARMLKGLKERRLLGKFVSTTFDTDVKLSHQLASGQEIAGTVMFSDIRNFTTISENNPPEEIAGMLNTHLKEMVEIINENSGKVEQFIGDAIVAFFPGDSQQACKRALRAAAAMMLRHRSIQQERQILGKIAYRIGIGLDHGTVMAGILHSGARSEFTVIGPARTRAEQCETASKNGKHTRIMVTPAVATAEPEMLSFFFRHEDDLFELKGLNRILPV